MCTDFISLPLSPFKVRYGMYKLKEMSRRDTKLLQDKSFKSQGQVYNILFAVLWWSWKHMRKWILPQTRSLWDCAEQPSHPHPSPLLSPSLHHWLCSMSKKHHLVVIGLLRFPLSQILILSISIGPSIYKSRYMCRKGIHKRIKIRNLY